jgi:hypothetical protein
VGSGKIRSLLTESYKGDGALERIRFQQRQRSNLSILKMQQVNQCSSGGHRVDSQKWAMGMKGLTKKPFRDYESEGGGR